MRSFEEYLATEHPDFQVDEGIFSRNIRTIGRGLAAAGGTVRDTAVNIGGAFAKQFSIQEKYRQSVEALTDLNSALSKPKWSAHPDLKQGDSNLSTEVAVMLAQLKAMESRIPKTSVQGAKIVTQVPPAAPAVAAPTP